LGHLSGDGDSLIIGKVLGFTSLGVYNIANKISSFLNQNLMPIFEDIGFPIFTMYNHSNDIIRKQFMYATRLLSTILVPLYVLLILFAPVIIETLCGPKWVDAVLPLRILSVLSLVESVTYSTGMLYNALGKPGIKFYFTIAFTPVFLLLVWFFAIKGLVISCIVVTLLRVVNFLYHIYKTGSIINLSIPAFFKEIRHIAVPNILLTILYISVLLFLHNINTKYLMMIMYIPLIYVISYWLFKRETLKDYLLLCKIFPVVKMH
jgi:PST family polysaccharide transporter